MPKVSVYLPDALYDEVRKHDIAISTVTQQALEAEVQRQANRGWIERVRSRPPRVDATIDTEALIDEVRDEFGA
jgi:post-segregation antitoxin (ccd killing protein)